MFAPPLVSSIVRVESRIFWSPCSAALTVINDEDSVLMLSNGANIVEGRLGILV